MSQPSKTVARAADAPTAAANIVTLKTILVILRVVASSGFIRAAPSRHEVHHPTVESTKPTMEPDSTPNPTDFNASDDAADASADASDQRRNEIGESLLYWNLRR